MVILPRSGTAVDSGGLLLREQPDVDRLHLTDREAEYGSGCDQDPFVLVECRRQDPLELDRGQLARRVANVQDIRGVLRRRDIALGRLGLNRTDDHVLYRGGQAVPHVVCAATSRDLVDGFQ
jgi:hypothetical protein